MALMKLEVLRLNLTIESYVSRADRLSSDM